MSNRLTGEVMCTWDTDGILYVTTDGLSSYEKRLITMILKIWRGTPRIKWNTWDRHAQRINDRWGRQYAPVSVPIADPRTAMFSPSGEDDENWVNNIQQIG